MKQVIHIFRKDVRHLWKEVAASLAMIAFYMWAEPGTWAVPRDGIRDSIAGWLSVFLPLSWWLLVVRSIQDEPLVGDRQFWVTRPYEWKSLLAEKILFIVTFVHAPLLIAQAGLLKIAGFPLSSANMLGILWMQRLWAVVTVALATLAAITAGIGKMALAILGIGLYFQLIVYLASLLPQGVDRAERVPNFLIFALPVAICVGVTIWQYARRRTLQARIALAGALVAPFVVQAATPHRYLAERAYPVPASTQQAPVQISFVPLGTRQPRGVVSTGRTENKDWIVIEPELHITGIAAGSMLATEGSRVEIEAPDGFRWDLGWGGGGGLQLRDGNYFHFNIMLERKVYERVKDVPVKLRVSFALADYSLSDTRTLTVPNDEIAVPGLGLCEPGLNSQGVQCRYAWRQPGYIAALTQRDSTCPGVDKTNADGQTQTWVRASPIWAEFGISPVNTLNLTMTSGNNQPMLCPGTPFTLTFPREQGRSRATVEMNGVRLSDFRQPGDTSVPAGAHMVR